MSASRGSQRPRKSVFDITYRHPYSAKDQKYKNHAMAFFFEQGRNRRVAEGLRSLQEVNKVLREVEPYLNPVAREDFVTRLHVIVWLVSTLNARNGRWPQCVYVYIVNPMRLKYFANALLLDAQVSHASSMIKVGGGQVTSIDPNGIWSIQGAIRGDTETYPDPHDLPQYPSELPARRTRRNITESARSNAEIVRGGDIVPSSLAEDIDEGTSFHTAQESFS